MKTRKLKTEILNKADKIIFINDTENIKLIFGYIVYRMANIHIKLFGFYTFNMDGENYLIISKDNND